MKKALVIVLALVLGTMFFVGCDEDPASAIESPRNLAVTGNADGETVVLNWSASNSETSTDGIDGYYIYLNGVQVGDVASGVYTYSFSPTALGTIGVTAYLDEDESDAAEVSTALVTGAVTCGGWTSTSPSAVAWNYLTGAYTLYGASETNASSIDIVWDSRDNTLNDAATFWTGTLREAWIASMGSGNYAPGSGSWNTTLEVSVSAQYAINIVSGSNNYYMLATVSSINTTTGDLILNYAYQKVPNYKRIK